MDSSSRDSLSAADVVDDFTREFASMPGVYAAGLGYALDGRALLSLRSDPKRDGDLAVDSYLGVEVRHIREAPPVVG